MTTKSKCCGVEAEDLGFVYRCPQCHLACSVEQEKVEYICSGHDTHSWCKDCAHNHNHPLWVDGKGVGCNDPNCNIKSRGNKICEVVK